jgi:hypothetical protein
VKPLVRQIADEIHYTWPELGVRVGLSRLRETDAGLVRGMINVQSMRPEHTANGGGHIWWAMVTLSTATDRKTLVQKLEHFAPREHSGWEHDIDRCFQDAYQRHTRVPEPVDLADVETPLETEFLYRPVLPAGQVTLLLADQGSTKSYLMLYLACCTVLGRESVFGPPLRQGPAIYFDWEVDERVASRRLAWICRGLGIEKPRHLYYVNMSERGRLMDRFRDMKLQIDRIQPVLALIDSLTFATGGDLNSAEFAAPTMSAIGSLGDGLSKLASAHPSKASRNGNASDTSVIGSGLFEFRARAIWLMRRESERRERFTVSLTTRKPFDGAPAQPLAYRLHFDNELRAVRFEAARIEDSHELAAQTLSLPERIRMILDERGAMDTNALAVVCDTSRERIKTACNRMSDVTPLTSGERGNPTVWARTSSTNGKADLPWWNRQDQGSHET